MVTPGVPSGRVRLGLIFGMATACGGLVVGAIGSCPIHLAVRSCCHHVGEITVVTLVGGVCDRSDVGVDVGVTLSVVRLKLRPAFWY